MSAHDARTRGFLASLTLYLLSACSEANVAPNPPAPNPSLRVAAITSCGASFRMITEEQDSLMAPYGIPNSVDTVDTCEAWTGSDYQYQATAIGSSDDVQPFVDSVQTTIYQSGYVTGYTPSGSPSAPATSVGSTAFDMLYASSSLRQASYDYPYYGVSSPDPSACLKPPCPIFMRATSDRALPTSSRPASASASAPPAFAKHGLSRLGIRALVDDAEELSPSGNGDRRFRSVGTNETIIRSIDPKTQLLVAEESATSTDTLRTTHFWTAVKGGYVREHSVIQSVEQINGRRIKNQATITFQGVRINDVAFPSLVGPDVSR